MSIWSLSNLKLMIFTHELTSLTHRARVKSIRYNADRAGKLDGVIGHCLDTGSEGLYPLEAVYRFPARLAERPAFTTELIVCGIKPTENDQHFSSYCKKELINRVVGEVLEGNIELALGNTLWVRSVSGTICDCSAF